MTAVERKAILHALASAQASIDLALSLMLGNEELAEQGCKHPPEQRQDLRGFGGGPEHYVCKTCGAEVGGHDRPQKAVPGPDGSELSD